MLQKIVDADVKQRYELISEAASDPTTEEIWLIKANQGHSLKVFWRSRYMASAHGSPDGPVDVEAYISSLGYTDRRCCSRDRQGCMELDMYAITLPVVLRLTLSQQPKAFPR